MTSDRAAGSPPHGGLGLRPRSDAGGVPRRPTGLAIRSNGAFATPRFATGWYMNQGATGATGHAVYSGSSSPDQELGGSLAGNDSREASSSGSSTSSGESVIHTLDLSLGAGSFPT